VFDAGAYAELIGDLLLTIRKLEKHVAGEPLADEHVEELIGKVWTKKDRQPVSGLTLVEYAFLERTTADAFVIRESRFVDLESGQHFSEKQILPGFLVKRTEPKKSWAGRVLGQTAGSIYPTFSPRRLDVESIGSEMVLGTAALAIGTLGSVLAPNQIVATLLSAGMLGLTVILWWIAHVTSPPLSTVSAYADLYMKHFPPFMTGVLSTANVLYYVSVAYLFLQISIRVLEARRWH